MRNKSWGQYKKSLIDRIIESFRFVKIRKYIKRKGSMLDLGCGYRGDLLFYFKKEISSGIGIDIAVDEIRDGTIKLVEGDINYKINLPSNSYDIITMLAVIEHLENPKKTLKESLRLLKKNGRLIITTPNIKWKWLLELMAFLKIISSEEIKDHKRYYSKETLVNELSNQGFKTEKIRTQSYPLNLFIDFVIVAVAKK